MKLKRQRKPSSLFIGLFLFGLLIVIIFSIPPENILVIGLFLLLVLVTFYYLLSFMLNHLRRAFLISFGITSTLSLRVLDLKHWLYPVLITAIIISIELYFKQKLEKDENNS